MKSKRAKACEISTKVRKIVYERDKGNCVLCGRRGNPNSHYIKRSQSGLGIPENVVTLCSDCHYQYDFGKNCKWYEEKVREYLKNYYGDSWKEEDLIYDKWKKFGKI